MTQNMGPRRHLQGNSVPLGRWQVPLSQIDVQLEPTYSYTPSTSSPGWRFPAFIQAGHVYTWQLLSFPPIGTSVTPIVGKCRVVGLECVVHDYDDPPALSFSGSSSCSVKLQVAGADTGQMFNSALTNQDTTPIAFTGTPAGAIPWTATTGQAQLIDTNNSNVLSLVGSGSGGAASGFSGSVPGSSPLLIGMSLYISQWNGVTSQWDVRDVLDPDTGGGFDDYLDYTTDVFYEPVIVGAYSGRRWALELREEIELCSGEALHVSFTNPFINAANIYAMPFIRCNYILTS